MLITKRHNAWMKSGLFLPALHPKVVFKKKNSCHAMYAIDTKRYPVRTAYPYALAINMHASLLVMNAYISKRQIILLIPV